MPSSDPKGGVRNGMGTDRWRNDHTGPVAPSYSYDELLRRRGSLLTFVRRESAGDTGVAAAAEAGTRDVGSAASLTQEQREEAKTQLRAILGAEVVAGQGEKLLERCAWDVQRAVEAHFNGEGDAPSTARAAVGNAGASAREVPDALRPSIKRPSQSASAEQQRKKGKQRSVLSMWGQN